MTAILEFIRVAAYPLALLCALAILAAAFNPFAPRNEGE